MILGKIHVGSAGWSYKDWVGPFYPKGMTSDKFLKYYSKYFDIVEINSTFYDIPDISTIKKWSSEVPESFRFSVKVWQKITHERNPETLEEDISVFLSTMVHLEPKISSFLLQFPASFRYSDKNIQVLLQILINFLTNKIIVIELRHNSWFTEKVQELISNIIRNLIKKTPVILGTVYLNNVDPFYFKDQTAYYIRVIGDRAITVFNRVQRDNPEISGDLEQKIKELSESHEITDIFVIFNNHFTGFSPQDSINFQKRMGLPYKNFNRQTSLMDYLK